MACRDTNRADDIARHLIATTNNRRITVQHLDLTSLASVVNFAQQFRNTNVSIYALINNAGIFYAQPANTNDNIEVTFQTNYLGPFLLTVLLLPALRRRPQPTQRTNRIVFLSSEAHLQLDQTPLPEFHVKFEDTAFNRFAAYQYSKLYLVLFANRLNRLLSSDSDTTVSAHCVDPGNAETNIYRTFPQLANPWLFALQKPIRFFLIKTPFEAAQSIVHAVASVNRPPFYIKNLRESHRINYRALNDPTQTDVLWMLSRSMCAAHMTSII